ncbi:MAG: Ig-like domain-containing protein, partial [Aeoliella sp.]
MQDDWFEVDQNSTGFEYNVTLNDYYRVSGGSPIDVIDRVTSVTQPQSGGTVTISADEQGVVYSPPTGFTGTDTFTYIADDLHEATVRVQVTRPVRDDFFYQGVYQDTPNNVVDVLANDFIGNGYEGPRAITSVGPTENGGTIAIAADGRTLVYTPEAGYVGQDRFTYTVDGVLEAEATVNVQALAQNDGEHFCVTVAHGVYTLQVLENDYFNQGYLGPGEITGVEVTHGSGDVAIIGGSALRFSPDSDGYHVIRYTVDDQYEAEASVRLTGHLASDLLVVDQNSAAESHGVLGNDFQRVTTYHCPSSHYLGPRLITGVTQSVNGGTVTIAEDGKSVSYTPPADFLGRDRFTYTVDEFMSETVSVEVIRRVRDDSFRVDSADGTQSLPVLVNDLFGADYTGTGAITHVTATSRGGTVVIGENGQSIEYTPADDFVGVDTFTYTVDGQLKAEVSVVVDAAPSDQLPTFDSADAYVQFLIDSAIERYDYLFGTSTWQTGYEFFDGPVDGFDGDGLGPAPTSSGDRNHSETNVQVAGVDEGDIVEFDADYVYSLTDD